MAAATQGINGRCSARESRGFLGYWVVGRMSEISPFCNCSGSLGGLKSFMLKMRHGVLGGETASTSATVNGTLEPVLFDDRRLGGKEGSAALDACPATPRIRLEKVE